MVGRFSMLEELGVMKKLNVMLSMDSANMHLCSLVGTPVVSVWGPSHPYVGFYAWGQPLSNAVQLDLPCRPCSECGAEPCYRGDMACMDIPCQNVFLKIKEFL
ncbi:MAG: glycosyl transferase family 1, partial [Paludibacteraceae bacterium]|nr:glycosyl transferase family 1 [Paludibacteraceae bacterium]